MQGREGVKAGCNGKDICGWESGENSRTGAKTCVQYGGKKYCKIYTVLSLFYLCAYLLTVFVLCVLLSYYVYLFILFVLVVPCVYLLYFVCIAVLTLDAGLLARRRYPEGPATGHFDT